MPKMPILNFLYGKGELNWFLGLFLQSKTVMMIRAIGARDYLNREGKRERQKKERGVLSTKREYGKKRQ
jgi:hypothetical protein